MSDNITIEIEEHPDIITVEVAEGGTPGAPGRAFTFADFTPEQLAALKGSKGDPFHYADFTPAQLEALKGAKGDAFTFADFTPEQLAALKGEPGPPAAWGSLGGQVSNQVDLIAEIKKQATNAALVLG